MVHTGNSASGVVSPDSSMVRGGGRVWVRVSLIIFAGKVSGSGPEFRNFSEAWERDTNEWLAAGSRRCDLKRSGFSSKVPLVFVGVPGGDFPPFLVGVPIERAERGPCGYLYGTGPNQFGGLEFRSLLDLRVAV